MCLVDAGALQSGRVKAPGIVYYVALGQVQFLPLLEYLTPDISVLVIIQYLGRMKGHLGRMKGQL